MAQVYAGGGPSDVLVVSGTITNDQGKPLKDVSLQFFLNGKKIDVERFCCWRWWRAWLGKAHSARSRHPRDADSLRQGCPFFSASLHRAAWLVRALRPKRGMLLIH
jgi:hypothetical protein